MANWQCHNQVGYFFLFQAWTWVFEFPLGQPVGQPKSASWDDQPKSGLVLFLGSWTCQIRSLQCARVKNVGLLQ